MERRASVYQLCYFRTTLVIEVIASDGNCDYWRKKLREMTKSLPISKEMVYGSYLNVVSNAGAAGIDGETIEMFNADLRGNLYKLWNRMASGSYFPPPVRRVLIDKKGERGGKRPLGIPTVADRIAQGVVKDYLEPIMERVFHPWSYGYRPGRSAHDALAACRKNCMSYGWVIDVDIRGFFDNLNHAILLDLVGKHTQEKWVLLHIERWLTAGVEQEDGSIATRTKGTPQGGVASPLLSNIYLHHGFDRWMAEYYRNNPFERYADDIIIHCRTKQEAEGLLEQLHKRMAEYGLELHPEKTKVVYCKNYRRQESHEQESFDFLSYSFQPRMIRSKRHIGEMLLVFSPAISQKAKKHINDRLRLLFKDRMSNISLAEYAERLNPRIRGWFNYYAKYHRDEVCKVFYRLNILIRKWIKNTYKIAYRCDVYKKYQQIVARQPDLFYHWIAGAKQ